MKKILVLLLTIVMLFSMSFNCFAAFVQSPSGNDAPEVVEDETSNESEDCTADIVVTSYSERDSLPDDIKDAMENAYNQISQAIDVSNLSDDLKEYCKDNNIDTKKLKVSDLFSLSYVGCGDHDEHGYFTITLNADTLANFVGLLHFTENGWELIKSAKVIRNGTAITFKIDIEDYAPFAIVVDTSKPTSSPQTGDNSNITMWVVVLAVCIVALGATLFFIAKRKKA